MYKKTSLKESLDRLEGEENKWSTELREAYEAKDMKREAGCLEEMGHIYLSRGKIIHDGMDYVKAAALYNAALARYKFAKEKEDNDTEIVARVEDKIKETEQAYIGQEIEGGNVPTFDNNKNREERKEKLLKLREKSHNRLIDIVKKYPAYEEDHKTQDRKKMLEKNRLKAIRTLCEDITLDMKAIVKDLFTECLQITGQLPCKYALMALGSLATDTITPYSDLELAILLEEGKDSLENKEYFRKAVYLMWIRVVNYGETILPTVQIKSLAKPENEYESWFEDFVTPRGFSFDGQVPWASKTPLGREATVDKPSIELIRTPKTMASLHLEQLIQGSVGYDLNYALLNVSLVDGSEKLVTDYQYEVKKILDKPLIPGNEQTSLVQSKSPILKTVRKLIAYNRIINILKNFNPGNPFKEKINYDVKREIYRLPTMIATYFCLQHNILENNPWIIFEKSQKIIHQENSIHLMTITSIATELRLRTYQHYNKQRDKTTGLQQITGSSEITQKDQLFCQDNVAILARFYATIIPFEKNIPNFLEAITSPDYSLSLFKEILYSNEEELKASLSYNFMDYAQTIKLITAKINLLRRNEERLNLDAYFTNLALAYQSLGNYENAIRYHEEALQMSRQKYGENSAHASIATPLDHLATAFCSLGNYDKAKTYYEQAIQMRKQIYGENSAHPHIAASLNNLGGVFNKLGKHEEAITYHKQVFQMRKQIYGENSAHPDIASSLKNLAINFLWLGNYQEAIVYHERALQMFKHVDVYGENSAHPDIASTLDNLALAYFSLGNYQKAITYHEQALQMSRQIYGEKSTHPDIASSLNNLGNAFNRLGNYGKAKTYFENAHQMRKKIYGENSDHPDIADSLNNLADFFDSLGNYEKAIRYQEQALQMFKRIYGENSVHQYIATSLHNLAKVFINLGNHKMAKLYFEQAYQMRKQLYGENGAHPHIAESLQNLAANFLHLGNYEEAKIYGEQAYQLLIQIYGENSAHPAIVISLGNLAALYCSMGNYEKALTYIEQSLQMTKEIYGENAIHPDISSSLNNMATAYYYMGNYENAVTYFEKSLQMTKQIYGENTIHPDISSSLNNMAEIYGRMGNDEKALAYNEQAHRMNQQIYGENSVNPHLASHLNALAASYGRMGNYEKAKIYSKQAHQMLKEIYGENSDHPSIAISHHNLATAHSSLGNNEEAITCHEQALQIRRKTYGEHSAHPEIAYSLSNLASAFLGLGNYERAITYHEKAYQMRKKIHGEQSSHLNIALSLKKLGLIYPMALKYLTEGLAMLNNFFGNNSKHQIIMELKFLIKIVLIKIGLCYFNKL